MIGELAAEPDLVRVLDAGRLAPSSYNTQPWQFVWLQSSAVLEALDIDQDAQQRWLLLLEDASRRLPVADTLGAETLISLGTCLANLLLAGRCVGWEPTVVSIDDPEPLLAALSARGAVSKDERVAALVGFRAVEGPAPNLERRPEGSRLQVQLDGELVAPNQAPGGLLGDLSAGGREAARIFGERRSERGPYSDEPLPQVVFDRASSAASELLDSFSGDRLALFATSNPDKIARAAKLLFRTTHRALKSAALAREATSWFRSSREDASSRGDGEPLDAAGIEGLELWFARRALHPTLGPLLMRLGGARRVAGHNSSTTPNSALLMGWACDGGSDSPWESEARARRSFMSAGVAIEGAWLSLVADGAGLQFMTPCLLFEDSRQELAEILELDPGYVPLSLQRAGIPEFPSQERPIRRALSELVRIV